MEVKVKFEAARLNHSDPFRRRYPFPDMHVGDGMAVKFPVPYGPARSAASKWASKHGWTFKTQVIGGVKVIVRVA